MFLLFCKSIATLLILHFHKDCAATVANQKVWATLPYTAHVYHTTPYFSK